MHALRNVILEHTHADGVHHDWLIEDPALPDPHAPSALLWAARVLPPPTHWRQLGRFDVEVIAPHRRRYLDYQGPISHGRGRVRRVAEGVCRIHLWTGARIFITTDLIHSCQQIELRLCGGTRWMGVCA